MIEINQLMMDEYANINKTNWRSINTIPGFSCYRTVEETYAAMDLLVSNNPTLSSIIDIGGGDSKLVDFLLDQGYTNISVLDISARALEKAKIRLGEKSKLVNWIESDITKFRPTKTYDIWHDRASFHFLTQPEQISKYLALAEKHIKKHFIIGTFSEQGPAKCSGLVIKQYNERSLVKIFKKHFEIINYMTENHITPFKTSQNFLFCNFKKINNT